jgi:hypothetical protein
MQSIVISLARCVTLLAYTFGFVQKVHPSTMWFEKERGNNHYSVIGILEGFDFEKPLDDDDNTPLYEPWDTSVDFFDCVKAYYEGSTEVKCLTKDDCDSDEE